MKNKIVAIIAVIAVVCIAWLAVLSNSSAKEEHIAELYQSLESNIEVRTYKNTLPIYEELISIEPENIDLYVGLADAYLEIEWYGDYLNQCRAIVKKFPAEKIGYLKLLKYYDAANQAKEVIEVYAGMPEALQADSELLAIYEKSEWKYRFASGGYTSVSSCSGDTYVIEENGLFGYKSKSLSGEIEPKFTVARPFIEDYAAVYYGNEWYFIDGEGDRVLATKETLEDLYSLSEGYAVAKINGKYGYIDADFQQYSFVYEDATSFYNGVAAVKKDGKWGLINRAFEEVTPFVYEDVIRDEANICSRAGNIFLQKDGKYHLLFLTGETVTSETFEDAELFYSKVAAIKKGGKWGFIDSEGNLIIDCIYDDASSFASGIAAVKKGDYWGCVDANGKEILSFSYGDATVSADNGVAVVRVGDVYRFVQFIKFN